MMVTAEIFTFKPFFNALIEGGQQSNVSKVYQSKPQSFCSQYSDK